MTLSEYLTTCCNAATCNGSYYDKVECIYSTPRIFCNDGFSISIQTNHAAYCASENGRRKYGEQWLQAEWGFPSEQIDAEKYNAECWDVEKCDTTNTVGGYVDIKLLAQLIEVEHKGIDLSTTISQYSKAVTKGMFDCDKRIVKALEKVLDNKNE